MSTESPEEVCTILLVGEDPSREGTHAQLLDTRIASVLTLTDFRATLPFLEQNAVSLIVLFINPAMIKADLLARICCDYPYIPVIVLTESPDVESAVTCMKSGAADCFVTPVDFPRPVSYTHLTLPTIYSV